MTPAGQRINRKPGVFFRVGLSINLCGLRDPWIADDTIWFNYKRFGWAGKWVYRYPAAGGTAYSVAHGQG
jgi:hypothetical protein